MDKINVLLTLDLSAELLDTIRAVSPRLEVRVVKARQAADVPAALWVETEIYYAFGLIPPADRVPRLRWIQLHSAGANQVPSEMWARPGLRITTTSGIHATPIAEYVWASILAFRRRVPRMLGDQAGKTWPEKRGEIYTVAELRGQTLGIVGYGSIGREIGRVGKALGMRLLANKRSIADRRDTGWVEPGTGDPQGVLPDAWYGPDRLHEMLAQCDVVVVALPLTARTRHALGPAELAALPAHAYLVNIGRGDVIDEAAMSAALQTGRLGGAGLDVYESEPLPAASPLWGLDNVILSPHISGFTPQYNARSVTLFCDNLRRYLDGAPLINQVDHDTRY